MPIIGHEGVLAFLTHSLKSGRMSHAYLFIGPRHVGKMAAAIHLAKAVSCQNEDEKPCQSCSQCLRVDSGQHVDVQVISTSDDGELVQGSTRIGIGKVRELQKAASLHPYEGPYRVFIINEAELLSNEAANSLLKTLEEPPPQVLLVLLTTNEDAVLPTIRSRCSKIELRPMSVVRLSEILAAKFSVDKEKAELLARLSEGCPGWAVTAIQDENILETRINTLNRLAELSELGLEGRFRYAVELAAIHSQDRQRGRLILGQWLSWWRDLLLVKGSAMRSVTNTHMIRHLQEQSRRYSLDDIQRFIHRLINTQADLERNVNARMVVELLMLRMPQVAVTGSTV